MTWALLAAAACAVLTAAFYGLAWLRGWRIGRASWPLAGAGGGCRRCLTAFTITMPHPLAYDVTERGTSRALMVLCERCWRDLGNGEARYPFYADHLTEWIDVYKAAGDEKAVERIKANAMNVAAALRAGL